MKTVLLFFSIFLELFIPGLEVGRESLIEPAASRTAGYSPQVTARALPVKERSSGKTILAEAGMVADFDTGTVLIAKNANKRVAIASITKLMTAVVVIENHKLDEVVIVPEFRLSPLQTDMGLKKGDKLTVGELLHGLLIPSGADAAITLATHHSGSVEKFVEEMNLRAVEFGLKNTNFKNVIGEDQNGAYSTASDLIALGRIALTNPTVRAIVAKRAYTAKGTNGKTYKLLTTNQILDGKFIIGIKTGFTFGAGQCLLSLATSEKHSVISVVLNSPDRFAESRSLLNWAFNTYGW